MLFDGGTLLPLGSNLNSLKLCFAPVFALQLPETLSSGCFLSHSRNRVSKANEYTNLRSLLLTTERDSAQAQTAY